MTVLDYTPKEPAVYPPIVFIRRQYTGNRCIRKKEREKIHGSLFFRTHAPFYFRFLSSSFVSLTLFFSITKAVSMINRTLSFNYRVFFFSLLFTVVFASINIPDSNTVWTFMKRMKEKKNKKVSLSSIS